MANLTRADGNQCRIFGAMANTDVREQEDFDIQCISQCYHKEYQLNMIIKCLSQTYVMEDIQHY